LFPTPLSNATGLNGVIVVSGRGADNSRGFQAAPGPTSEARLSPPPFLLLPPSCRAIFSLRGHTIIIFHGFLGTEGRKVVPRENVPRIIWILISIVLVRSADN